MGRDYVYICSVSGIAIIILFVCAIWIFTARATLDKILEAGQNTSAILLTLRGFFIAPFVAFYYLTIRFGKFLLKLLLGILIVILIAFALLLSPFIGIVYLVYLAIEYAFVLGERLLNRSINFPD